MTPTPLPRRVASRLTEPLLLLPVLAIVLLGVIWGTTFNLIHVERSIAGKMAASSSFELAETYEAQVVRALREIDQSLKFVQFAHERNGGRVDLDALRNKGLLLPDLLFVTFLADAEGRVEEGTRPVPDANIAGRDYFRAHLQRNDGVAVGHPVQQAGDPEWKLHFSRRLENAAGAFAGVVVVSVPASYFTSGYEGAKLGRQGLLGLLGTDGVFRVRRSGDQVSSGNAVDYRSIVPREPKLVPTVAESPWDHVRRYSSARELFDFPVAVVVGLSEDEQLAAVNASARTYLLRAAIGSLVLLLFLGALARVSMRSSEFRRRAEAALNLRHRAIESSVNAIVIASLEKDEMPIEYVNPAFERITGYGAGEAIGRNGSFLLGDDKDQPAMQEIELALRERRDGHAVLRNYRKDGSVFWNDFYMAPVRDDAGTVTHYVGVMNDVTDAKRYEEQLAHQANFDTLTGLANRNLLQDRLQQAIAGARRNGGTVITVLLDVDNFKVVNDSLGHNVGDDLLCAVADRLRECVRDTDTVARLGGDEFVLVLSNKSADATTLEREVTALMDKLLGQVARPLMLRDREMRPTCSLGIAFHPQDGADAETLLRNADAAMYRAKELGRNRFQFFTADVHERIRRRMDLETSLRLALERDEFELHYQPQVCLKQGGIVGAEALLRWRHPEKGIIGPNQFIGFAEETGLIVDIGEWVVRRACRQNKAWQLAGLPPIPVAVNMSAKQCEQQDLDQMVRRALDESGLDPKYLELEITESISMANPDLSVPLMHRLKETGVALSIDDFGTGFSNLSYLKRFPVDRLKIDLSFVREITTDPGSLAISEAIITMSHSLNMQVLAEGVENASQLELLGARNCDSIQGFFFSPPVPPDAFAHLLQEGRRLPPSHLGKREIHHARATLQ